MKVLTARNQIRELPGKLKHAWQRFDGTWMRIAQREPDTEKIYDAVCALDLEAATVDDVRTAMGFGDWVYDSFTCHECKQTVDKVVQLGEEPDYDSSTANICVACLRKALKAVKS